MLRTLKFLLFQVFYLIGTLRYRPRYRALMAAGDRDAADQLVSTVAHRWALASLRCAGAKVEVEGRENLPADRDAAVYIGNHLGDFDILLVLAYLGAPKALVAKDTIGKIPIVRGWMDRLHCVFVKRDDPRMAAKAFREAAQNVEDGYSMIIFPEGTRSRDNEVHEFKAGAFKIAQRSHATVVPFCIDGTDSFFERNGHRINPKATLRLKILPPLDTSAYTRDDWKALPALCETQVRDSLGEMRISESN